MDLVDLTKEIDKLNKETIPELKGIIEKIADDAHELLDRLNGAIITTTVSIPPRKKK